jgi:hypothetical protein
MELVTLPVYPLCANRERALAYQSIILTLLKTRGKLFSLLRRGGILMHITTEEICEIATSTGNSISICWVALPVGR